MGDAITWRASARHAYVFGFATLAVSSLATGVVRAEQPVITVAAEASATSPATAVASGVTSANPNTVAGDASRTTFVIGLERAVDFQVFSLGGPNRVIVELPEMKLQLPTMSGSAPVGLVRSFRGGVSSPGKTRVVIDVASAVIVEKAHIEGGKAPRLVLDIVPVDAAKPGAPRKPFVAAALGGLGAGGVQPPMPKAAVRPDRKQAASFKHTIVIDPGHGGHDSGATKYGTIEKNVVLAFALKLRDKLNASGRYNVLMTRDDDRFVDLDERRAFGDRNKAALFIAVHADYAGSSARGATIYSLRESTSRDLQRSAKGEVIENVLSAKEQDAIKRQEGTIGETGGLGAVKGFLASLAQKEVDANKDRTHLFSKSVIEFMGASTPMMSNPDREANFRVLKSGKMPSVLIELAYVTNSQDAANLKSDAWRDKVTTSIHTAIENYFSHQAARNPLLSANN